MTINSNTKQLNPLVITAAYYLAFIVLGLVTGAEGPSLPKLAEHTASTLDRISLIFVFASLGYLAGSFMGGQAYDRFPGHRLMACALVVIGATALLLPVAGALWLLLAIFFVLGLAMGTLDVGGNTLLLWLHGEKVGPFMNGLHFFFGIGAFVAPLILAQVLAATGDIHWIYWVCSLICIPLAVWLWLLSEPERLRTVGEAKTPFPAFPVILFVAMFIIYVGLEMGFGSWIYTYTLTVGLGTLKTAAYLNSAFWGAFTLGRLLGVWVSGRLRSRIILFLDLTGCLASVIIVLLWRESALALWIATIGLGLFMASVFPTLMMLAGESMRVSGAITGWFLVGSGAGNMFLPWLIGQAFVFTGPQAMPVIVLVDIVIFLAVLGYFVAQRFKSLKTPIEDASQS